MKCFYNLSSDKSIYSAKTNLAFIQRVLDFHCCEISLSIKTPDMRKYYYVVRRSLNTSTYFSVFFFMLGKDNVNVRSNVEAFGRTYLFPFNRLQG